MIDELSLYRPATNKITSQFFGITDVQQDTDTDQFTIEDDNLSVGVNRPDYCVILTAKKGEARFYTLSRDQTTYKRDTEFENRVKKQCQTIQMKTYTHAGGYSIAVTAMYNAADDTIGVVPVHRKIKIDLPTDLPTEYDFRLWATHNTLFVWASPTHLLRISVPLLKARRRH